MIKKHHVLDFGAEEVGDDELAVLEDEGDEVLEEPEPEVEEGLELEGVGLALDVGAELAPLAPLESLADEGAEVLGASLEALLAAGSSEAVEASALGLPSPLKSVTYQPEPLS
jgi:hypothetical protein